MSEETSTSSKETAYSLTAAFREFMRFGSPRVLVVAAGLALTARMIIGQWGVWDLLIPALLVLMWPLQEWCVHVFVLHMKPKKIGPLTLDPLVARRHRDHHVDPWNLGVVFVPLPVVLGLLPVVVLFWWAVTPSVPLWLTGVAAYLALSVSYEWTHYLIHSRYRPRSAFFKRLWTKHRLHHCKNENYWFGVSMTAGDELFGTSPDPKSVETSATCRDLHAK